MNNPTKIIRSKKEQLKIEIPAMPTWDSFDKIIDFLIKEYNAVVLMDADVPYWRRWILEINKQKIELIHGDMDENYLQAPEEGESIILQIGQDLEERLMGDLFEIDSNLQGRILKTEKSAILTFWHNNKDLTGRIYKNLDHKKLSFKDLQLFGAPFSYELLMIPLEYLDELLNDIKMMDKIDLEKNSYEEMQSLLMKDRAMHAYLLWMEFSRIAREAMIDQESVKMLKAPWTFETFVEKAIEIGKTGDEVWQYIIDSAKRIDFRVDKFLGIKTNFQLQEGKIMNKPIYIRREEDKPLEIEIPAMPSRDGFNKLIDFLMKEYNAVVLFDADGPDARRWILESNGTQFELVHDDLMGSALVAPSVDSEELVLKIGKDLEQRLMGEIMAIGDTIEASISKDEENVVLTFWNACHDVTEKIYTKLEGKSYFKCLIFGGAPYAYGLIQIPIEYLDELLHDIKMMDKRDLI